MTTFRVFCGWDARQAEAAEVFSHSVHQNTSMTGPIIIDLHFCTADTGNPDIPPACKRRGVTAFSYARFMCPWLCGYEGRALFADGCDQLCLGDVVELAALDMEGCAVKVVKHRRGTEARPRSWTSLMLMDCASPELRRWTPDVVEHASDDRLMRLRDLPDDRIGDLPGEWNVLMAYADERVTHGSPSDLVLPKISHWSYLSDPNGGSWIDRSGSRVWAEARERWLAAK